MEQPAAGKRVAFFGGSFDPPHFGHLAVARAARAALELDCVLFSPVGVQPLKPSGSTASFEDRVDMPRLVEFYMRGRLHLEDWISAKLKLSEINEGFAAMKAGKTVRSVIMFDA